METYSDQLWEPWKYGTRVPLFWPAKKYSFCEPQSLSSCIIKKARARRGTGTFDRMEPWAAEIRPATDIWFLPSLLLEKHPNATSSDWNSKLKKRWSYGNITERAINYRSSWKKWVGWMDEKFTPFYSFLQFNSWHLGLIAVQHNITRMLLCSQDSPGRLVQTEGKQRNPGGRPRLAWNRN